jgi:hypothetical protein
LVLALAGAAALAACSSPDVFAPACPQLGIVQPGADMVRYVGTGRDLTDLVLDAHVVSVPGSCHWANKAHTKVEAKVQVAFGLARGPAMPGRSVTLPYFFAVAENDTIYDEQDYTLHAEFPANTDRISVTSPEVSMLFPVSANKSAAAYRIWVGFRLSRGEFDAYRTQRAP